MTPQPDHLIERAAALLNAGKTGRLRDVPAEPPIAGPANGTSTAVLVPFPLPLAPLLPTLSSAVAVSSPVSAADPAVTAAPVQTTVIPSPEVRSPQIPPLVTTAVSSQGHTPLVAPRPALARPSPSSARLDAPSLQPVITLEALERAGMVVARAARTRISEEYRIVVGRVLRALRDEPDGAGSHNVVMITSARPGEGKSFTALNLAGSIAQHSTEKVLLVDVDAKLRPISSMLGVGDRLGFHDLVVDPTLRPEDVVLNTAIGNLTVLAVGTRSGEVTDTVSVRPITPTITRLARRFPKHLIMLDAPPCLSTSDPHTIAPFVGQIVMVVEAERTQRSEVEASLELIRVCPTITMLLNKVKLTTSHTFGAYDYYGSYS